MKGILVIIDGLADLPNKQLGGKTPLEVANKPNIDYFSKKSKLGYMYSVGEKIVPESDAAVLSILGNKPVQNVRGHLEAIGAGVKIERGDLALRANFATIAKNRHVLDRRAGRTLTTKEAGKLAKAINKKVKLPCKFVFKNTVQHRGVLVLKGAFSDNITNTDPSYHGKRRTKLRPQFKFSEPLDDEENSKYTANIINEFIEQSNKILGEHKINQTRIKKGLLPANIILTRDAGTEIPRLNQFRNWRAIINMPLEIGIARASGMQVEAFDYPKMKSYDVYDNLYYALKVFCEEAIKLLKKDFRKYDYIYIHFKETDVPGHDNKPFEKAKMIEMIDECFFKEIRFLEARKVNILVTADHSTPCKMKAHSSDPVPVMFCDWKSGGKEFSEKNAKKGELGKLVGRELLRKTGFVG